MFRYQGSGGPLYDFLKVFGPALLEKYKPKGIVVFSAHWESEDEMQGEHLALLSIEPCFQLKFCLQRGITIVTDYGDENPLLFDYYGFPEELYKLKFKSKGDSAIAKRVVDLYKQVTNIFLIRQ